MAVFQRNDGASGQLGATPEPPIGRHRWDSGRARRPITDSAGLLVSLTATVGLALTLLFSLTPALDPSYQNRSLHVAKETAAALVLLLVAALLLGRFRRSGSVRDLLALAGVVLLAGKTLVFSVLAAILAETSGGLTTWRTTGAAMLGALLLAASPLARQVLIRDRQRAIALTAGGCLMGLGLLMIIAESFDLPAAFAEEPPETKADLRFFSQDPALLGADIGATVLFLVAGVAFARRASQDRDELQLWLGVGSIIAGMAYLNYCLFPSLYTDFLYTGDFFRIAAVIAWGIGTIRVISTYQTAYAHSAVLEERRRVARDLHDGVAQELAFISSQMHWLGTHGNDKQSSEHIMQAVQRALDESRSAISALSRPVEEPLHLSLAHTAEDVAGRVGARLELDLDDRIVVSPAWEDALPRILREAVTNAVRHGKARTVALQLQNGDGDVRLRISDDGEGFDPAAPRSEGSFGLISMKERTEALGGSFEVSSAPGQGTSVEIHLS